MTSAHHSTTLRSLSHLALALGTLLASAGPTPAQGRGDGGNEVVLKNDVQEITFSTRGGVPVRWRLTGRDPVELLDPEYVTKSRFRPLAVVTTGGDALAAIDLRPYSVRRDGERLTFTAPSGDGGLAVTKTYRLAAGSHQLELVVQLHNGGGAALPLGDDSGGPGITIGPGLGYSVGRRPELYDEGRDPEVLAIGHTAEGTFSIEAPGEAPFSRRFPEQGSGVGWGGVNSQYYAMLVRPTGDAATSFDHVVVQLETNGPVTDLVKADDRASYPCITLRHAALTLAAGATRTLSYSIYAGPKERDLLRAADPEYETVLFHDLWDWLAALCLALQVAIGALNGVLHSWGLAIVVFAVLVRVVTLPLSLYGVRQQMLMRVKMAKIKPKVTALREQYKGNAHARDQAILKLYKEHGINPFAHFKGCLPLLIQLPILIALFNLLLTSYDLRGVGFLWIHDLTLTDRLFPLGFSIPWLGSYFNLLPILMFVAQIQVGRTMAAATPGGPTGLAVYGMPIAMTLLFYPFPSGCMLFWTTGTILQIFEQRAGAAALARSPAAPAAS